MMIDIVHGEFGRSTIVRILAGLALWTALSATGRAQEPPRPRPVVQPSTIEGRVKLGDGAKIISTPFVQLYRDNDILQEVFTDRDGQFQFTNIYPGRYRIVARLNGYHEAEQYIDLIGWGGITRRVMMELKPLDTPPNKIAAEPTVSIAELNVPAKADKEYRKGKDDLRAQKYTTAIKHFRKAIEVFPTFPQAHSDLGLALWRSGDLAAAEQAFEACLKIDPAFLYARLNLAELYASSNRGEDARRILEETIVFHPAEGEPYLALGRLHFAAGRLDQAEAACREARSRRNTSADVHLLLAKIYLQRNQYAQLVQALEGYLEQAPDGPFANQVRDTLTKIKKPK